MRSSAGVPTTPRANVWIVAVAIMRRVAPMRRKGSSEAATACVSKAPGVRFKSGRPDCRKLPWPRGFSHLREPLRFRYGSVSDRSGPIEAAHPTRPSESAAPVMPDEAGQPSPEPQPDDGLAAALWLAGDEWNKAWQQRQTVPPVLYHYTDAAGIQGIAQSGQLWASNAAFLNDSTEIMYVLGVLETVTADLKGRYEQPIVHQFLDLVESVFRKAVIEDADVFLVCFCEDRDQLSQWRGYPTIGGGYAIGFRPSVIAQNRMLRKVIYEVETQREILSGTLTPSCDYLAASIEQNLSVDYLVKSLQLAAQMTAGNVAECGFCFKHPGFREESEWRMIRLSIRQGEPARRATPSFRERAGRLLPYLPVPLGGGEAAEQPIAEVVVGPTAHPELAASAARQLLASVGYENASEIVTGSEIPLRV